MGPEVSVINLKHCKPSNQERQVMPSGLLEGQVRTGKRQKAQITLDNKCLVSPSCQILLLIKRTGSIKEERIGV